MRVCLSIIIVLILAWSQAIASDEGKISIDSLSLNRSVAYLGEEITANTSINVHPSLRSQGIHVRFYLDETEIGDKTIRTFDSSGNARSEFSFIARPEGRFLLRVEASTEDRAIMAKPATRKLAILSLPGAVSSAASPQSGDETADTAPDEARADLQPVAIKFDIASPVVGQKTTMRTTVANVGNKDAKDVKVRLFINGQPFGDDISLSINSGTEAEIETEYQASTQGKKDVLVLINPDGEVEEKSNRNNLLSKTLIVRPVQESAKQEATAASSSTTPSASLPNLVIFIETIGGVHYTNDDKVRVYITNNSSTNESSPFMMGIRSIDGNTDGDWVVQQAVKNLAPGETVTLALDWPASEPGSEKLYVASVDVNQDVEESESSDNRTNPFRVLSVLPRIARQPALSSPIRGNIQIIQPAPENRIIQGSKLTLQWKSSGTVGDNVNIKINNAVSGDSVVSATTNNDGEYVVDFANQDAGSYKLSISSVQNRTISRSSQFTVEKRKKLEKTELLAPHTGASYRGEQVMNIVWPEQMKRVPDLKLNFLLTEKSSKQFVQLNNEPVSASNGEFSWQVPDDGTVFGAYRLEARSTTGKTLAFADELVFLPNFVAFEQTGIKGNKEEIITDLEIARTSFNGPNLEFLVMNNGPAVISPSGLINYSFVSYFVRKVPLQKPEDLVICKSHLLAELPVGEGQAVSLGRNPDCPLGEKEPYARFEYVVTRFTLPVFQFQFLKDPDMLNNMSKFYWPE
jgi:hypothetical protein